MAAIFEPHPRNYYETIVTTGSTTLTVDSTYISTTTNQIDDNFLKVFDEFFKGTEYENYVFIDLEKIRSATSVGMLTFNEAEIYLFNINNWCIENEITLPRIHVSDSYIGCGKIAFGFKTKEDLVRFELRWV